METSHQKVWTSLIVELTQPELDYIQDLTDRRCSIGKKSKRVSRYSEHEITFMGIAGEWAAAKGLGCLFNPFEHRGGDGHKGDLTRGDVTLSLKTRARHLPADFLFPTHQDPGTFPDNFGVVARWLDRYWKLQLVGYFSRESYGYLKESIQVGGTRSGKPEQRNGVRECHLSDIQELKERLDEIKDAEVSTAQKQGYLRYFRDRDYSRRSAVNIGDVCPQLAHLVAG